MHHGNFLFLHNKGNVKKKETNVCDYSVLLGSLMALEITSDKNTHLRLDGTPVLHILLKRQGSPC